MLDWEQLKEAAAEGEIDDFFRKLDIADIPSFTAMPEGLVVRLLDDYFPESTLSREDGTLVVEITEHIYTKYWQHKWHGRVYADAMLRDFILEQALQLGLDLADGAALFLFSGFGGFHKLCSVKAGVVVSNDIFRIGRQAAGVIQRHNLAGRRKHGHLSKSDLDGLRNLTGLLLAQR